MAVIKHAAIQTSSGFDTRDIGAEAQNIEVSRDSSGEIIEDITASGVTVDSTEGLSTTLKDLEDNKQAKLTFDTSPTSGSTNPVTSDGVYTAVQADNSLSTTSEKAVQNKVITSNLNQKVSKYNNDATQWDTTPTSGSTKPVTSGGIYTALNGKQNTLTFDSTPTEDSTNPVTSGGVYSQIQTLTNNDDAMINVLGAKNLLQCNNTTQTVRGITYQKNSDGSISTSGSVASSYNYSYFHVNEYQKLPKGKYILSGCYPNGSVDKWRLFIAINGTNYIDYGEGVEFELAEDATVDAIIRIESGYVSDGMTFYPMIRPASIANDTYVPYAKTNRQLTEGEVEDISSHFILNTTNVASAIVVAYKTGKVVTFNMVFTPIAGITNLGNKQFLVIDSGYRPKHKTVSEYDFYQAVWFEDVASSDTTYAVVMRIVAETGSFETPNNRGYNHTTNANSRVFVSGSYEVE